MVPHYSLTNLICQERPLYLSCRGFTCAAGKTLEWAFSSLSSDLEYYMRKRCLLDVSRPGATLLFRRSSVGSTGPCAGFHSLHSHPRFSRHTVPSSPTTISNGFSLVAFHTWCWPCCLHALMSFMFCCSSPSEPKDTPFRPWRDLFTKQSSELWISWDSRSSYPACSL